MHFVSPVLAKILESKHAGLGLLPKPTMLNKSGQIAPDAAQFDGGKQKAPVVTVSGWETDQLPPHCMCSLDWADFYTCRNSWTLAFKCGPGRAGYWLRCNPFFRMSHSCLLVFLMNQLEILRSWQMFRNIGRWKVVQ